MKTRQSEVVTASTVHPEMHDLSLVSSLVERAMQLRKKGDLATAIAQYQRAAAVQGAPAEVHFNLANALFEKGDWSAAQESVEQALGLDPKLAIAHLLSARCAQRLGELELAAKHYADVVQLDPKNFSAWLEWGNVSRSLGHSQKMLECYGRAAAVAPGRWEVLVSLVRAFEEAGQWHEAAIVYHQALDAVVSRQLPSVTPDSAETSQEGRVTAATVHWKVARFRLDRGDAPRALEAMRQALLAAGQQAVQEDTVASMHIDLGEVFIRMGLQNEAHRAFERASLAKSEPVLARLTETSFRNNLWQEALVISQRAVELHPESPTALWNLAHLYGECWQMDNALATLERAEQIAPQPGAASMRAAMAGRAGDVDQALDLYLALARKEGPRSRMCSSAAMSALYSDKLSASEVADLHRELFEPLGQGARSHDSFHNDRTVDRKIKVGFVTADFHHQHPVNIFMQPVLSRLNLEQIDLTIYFTGVSYDDQTRLAQSRVQQWVECTTWSDSQLKARIEADRIDVLMDLAGHTSMHRMTLFAQRAAPVQVTFLGYPGSTGVPNIDWILADHVVAPQGSDHLFSERVYRLPDTVFCFSPEAEYPYPQYTEAHAKRPLTFGSFNNVAKITPHTVAVWTRVLKAVPNSQMLLKAPSFKDPMAISQFQKRFLAEGIDSSRLIFRGPVGLTDMMAEYADVDIALDTVPYNGGTTTLQAMWMGVPVVVKAGENFVSRMGASFMQAAGLPDWVAASDDDYIKIAVAKAQDREALLRLKQGMRKQLLSSPAWDMERYANAFQGALKDVWSDFCRVQS